MAAASICHDYDRKLAVFVDLVISGKKTVDEVSEQFLVGSLGLADYLITARLKSNKEQAH